MIRRPIAIPAERRPALLLALLLALAACNKSDGPDGAGSGQSGSKLPATCQGSGREYGKFMAQQFLKDTDKLGPEAANKKDAIAKAIEDAIVDSCETEKWQDLPLDCLSSVFAKGDPKQRDAQTETCVASIGKDKSKKLDEAVATALKKAAGPASAPASAKPSQ